MKLSPLPTTAVHKEEQKEKSVFPYINFDQRTATQEPPVLTSFLGQNGHKNSEGGSEKQRMADLENMLNEAQNRAVVIEQEAYDKAYAAGEKSGLALGEKRAEQIIASMGTILQAADQELERLQKQSIDIVLSISQNVVSHVMGDENLNHIQQGLEQSIHKVMDGFLAGSDTHFTLLIHPQDLAMFTRMQDLPEELNIRAHQDVKAGSCRLVSGKQDLLIDPNQAVDDAIAYIRKRLLNHD